jgi:hypothetical protein
MDLLQNIRDEEKQVCSSPKKSAKHLVSWNVCYAGYTLLATREPVVVITFSSRRNWSQVEFPAKLVSLRFRFVSYKIEKQ